MKRFIFYPLLFTLFPIFSLISSNAGEIIVAARLTDVLLPILIALGGTLVIWFIARAVTGNAEKAALITSVLVLIFFSYGYLRDILHGVFWGDFHFGRHRYLLSAVAFILIAANSFFWRTKKNLSRLTLTLNATSIFLVAISLLGTFRYFAATGWSYVDIGTANEEYPTVATSTLENLPDIYYIILDGYAAPSVLQETYNHPIDDFVNAMRERGFYVPEKSRANYVMTHVSLASSLNMRYLEDIGKKHAQSGDFGLTYRMIEDNAVQRFLKERGYTFVNVGSWWVATSRNRNADININPAPSEFWLTLKKTTILDPLDFKYGLFDIRREIYDSFFHQLESLRRVASLPEPTFTFAHIIFPHSPYVFNADGSYITLREEQARGEKENYVDQVEFVNKKIEKLADEILENSSKPPIIIFQADHGTNYRFREGNWERDKWDDDLFRERARIFNSYYLPATFSPWPPRSAHLAGWLARRADLPNGGSSVFYEEVTPVNTFRLIFSYYFGENFELLPDNTYFSNPKEPYNFLDVTDIASY